MDIDVYASGSTGNAYRVNDGSTSLLLDAGIPIKRLQTATGHQLASLGGCLVTHEHGDHCKAVKDLVKLGIDVYASVGTISKMGVISHRLRPVKSLQDIVIGTFKVIPFDVQHDCAEPLGFLLESAETGEKLLYATDTYYIKYRFNALNYIMIECNYDLETVRQSVNDGNVPDFVAKRIIKSHMSLEHLMDMLRANDLSQVRQIYLLHLSANNSNADRYRQAIQEITGAEVYVC